MNYENIIYEVTDQIAKITINRPDSLNALNPDVLMEIESAIQTAEKDNTVGVIILTGAGRAFCAGVDLKYLEESAGADSGDTLNTAARKVQTAIENVPKVVIAMVNGFCITGGLEIALSCDLIVTADEAKFSDSHVRWGLRCTWGMSQRLPHRVGMTKARELTFTADMITGKQAEEIGLANLSVPLDKLGDAVKEMADKILANSLDAVAAHKYLYNQSMKDFMAKGLDREYTTKVEINDTMDRLTSFGKK
jgi:enoyl-CoA hydratase/carnithine racemase